MIYVKASQASKSTMRIAREEIKDPCVPCKTIQKRNEYWAQVGGEAFGRYYPELYESSPIALFRMRIEDDKLLLCNRAFVDLLGYKTRQECLSQCSLLHHHIDPRGQGQFLIQLKKKGRLQRFQTQLQQNGTVLWVDISAELFSVYGYIEGAIRDVSITKVLTPMEKKVLKSLLQGKCNKEIAYQLSRSVRTIEDHRARIMRKTGVQNLIELTRKSLLWAWRE